VRRLAARCIALDWATNEPPLPARIRGWRLEVLRGGRWQAPRIKYRRRIGTARAGLPVWLGFLIAGCGNLSPAEYNTAANAAFDASEMLGGDK
jgi:hypothetical protein